MQTNAYLIVKSLHIISVISWMAGVLYLFRLFVYYAEEAHPVVKERLSTMQERLFGYITVPAMVASVVFGATLLALDPELLSRPWLHAKLVLAAALVGVTLYARHLMDTLTQGTSRLRSKALRVLNEVPTLIMIGIVFLVVLKPWS